ncbi:hypothetical protein [Escherichia coli]|uniref:hypothetical protein n=1 Tax=Escherichia coli TaxID=562 RepID=UPI00111C49F6|nr:hypothetical protein [Escherichia coli]
MKKLLVLAPLVFGVLSSASYAGGGQASWQPKVEPINCIASGGNSFFWRNISDCNEVISKGYAKGVHYSGKFNYDDGSSIDFSGFVTPNQSYTPPKHPQGKKLASLSNTKWYWAK